MTAPWKYVLVPGRHHAMTRYQAEWIQACRDQFIHDSNGDIIPVDDETIWVFPIASANHHTTRRNPVPLSQRIEQVALFTHEENLRSLIYGVPDIPPTSRYAEHVVETARSTLDLNLTPSNTLVAVSTPVGDMYRELGYTLGFIEGDGPAGTPTAWDVVIAAANNDEETFTRITHPASMDVWTRYNLHHIVRTVFTDAVVSGEDGGLTDTRSYSTYADAFEATAARKWSEIKGWVRPGRLLDIGCATGQLLVEAGRDPALTNSDLIGVETDRWLHAEAEHRVKQGVFPNTNTFFYRRNILTGPVFAPNSIDSTITAALTHEIYSYGDGDNDLQQLEETIRRHTRSGGVWINSDTAGPQEPDRIVHLRLSLTDGSGQLALQPAELASMHPEEAGKLLSEASTWSKFRQFANDYPQLSHCSYAYAIIDDGIVELTIRDAMEYLLHKDYTDNWLSEMHESYTYRTWDEWRARLQAEGWTLEPGSGGYTNQWIVENRLAPVASLHDKDTGELIPWPDTHMRYAAVKNP